MSDLVTRDETTGLALTLPEGWQSLSDTGLGVVGFDAVGRQRGDAFVDNVTAAVSARAQSSDLDTIVADATVLWLDAVDTAHVLQALDLSGEFEGPDALQLVVGTYSTGIVSVTLFTGFVVSGDLLTRIDLHVSVERSRGGFATFADLVSGLTLPTSAPAPATFDVDRFEDALVEGELS